MIGTRSIRYRLYVALLSSTIEIRESILGELFSRREFLALLIVFLFFNFIVDFFSVGLMLLKSGILLICELSITLIYSLLSGMSYISSFSPFSLISISSLISLTCCSCYWALAIYSSSLMLLLSTIVTGLFSFVDQAGCSLFSYDRFFAEPGCITRFLGIVGNMGKYLFLRRLSFTTGLLRFFTLSDIRCSMNLRTEDFGYYSIVKVLSDTISSKDAFAWMESLPWGVMFLLVGKDCDA